MGRTACTEPQCLHKGALYLTVELHISSPYAHCGLSKASVPVQECTLPLFYLYYIDISQYTVQKTYFLLLLMENPKTTKSNLNTLTTKWIILLVECCEIVINSARNELRNV
jgi:hypothetical protein